MKLNYETQPSKLTETFGLSLKNLLGNSCNTVLCEKGDITLVVDPSKIKHVIYFLKNHSHCQYKILADITAVDYPEKDPRFQVVYQLLSVRYSHRIQVKTFVDNLDGGLPSITNVHPAANWYEREIWDLFGIFFKNHPDLRRILTDYGFEGHPMRKDFPLTGYVEVRYDEEKKRVVCEPLELSQEFRTFDFQSAWDQNTEKPLIGKKLN